MDYLLTGNGENNLSLQDMIECDMKTEFCDNFENENMRVDFDSPLAMMTTDSLSTTDLVNHNGLIAYNVCVSTPMTIDSKPDPSWLRSVSLSTSVLQSDNSVSSEVFQMVNPQTGLPVQIKNVSQVQMNNVSAGSEIQQHPVQYIQALPNTTIQQAIQQQQQHQQQQQQQPQTVNIGTQMQSLQNSQLINQALSNGTAVTLSSVSYPQIVQQQQQQHSPTPSSLVTQQLLNTNNNHLKKVIKLDSSNGKVFPKPVYSYSCLIAMALKNSETGALPVSEIYSFMTENFPYFKTAPDGWKNSVRHNLSLNKCFEKIENPKATGNTRKGCLWGLNPARIDKMDEEIAKWRKKDLEAIQRSMTNPDILEILEKGNVDIKNSIMRRTLAQQQEALMNMPSPVSTNENISVAAAAPTPAARPIVGDIQLSMIEIKPAEHGESQTPVKIKVEPIFTIKSEPMDAIGAVGGGGLTAEDLSVLDTSLSMDPSLGDIAMQNSLWEELGAEGISLDDIPLLSFGPSTSSSSPLTVQANKTGLSSSSASPLVSLLTNKSANGGAASHSNSSTNGLNFNHPIYALN